MRGFTEASSSGSGASTTAGDSQPAVFDGLGIMLVGMCSLFLAWGAVLVLLSLWKHARDRWRARRSGMSRADKERLERRRRRRVRHGNRGHQHVPKRPGAGAVRLHPAVLEALPEGADPSASWHANPMRSPTDHVAPHATPVVHATDPSRVEFASSRAPDRALALTKLRALNRASSRGRGRREVVPGRARGRRRSRGQGRGARWPQAAALVSNGQHPQAASTKDQLVHLRSLRADQTAGR